MADRPDPEDFVNLTNEQFVEIREAIAHRFGLLLEAYHRGMLVAYDEEQQALLAELEAAIGPPAHVGQQLGQKSESESP